MTFCLVAANYDQIVLGVDRRLTDTRGSVIAKDAYKIGHGVCLDASFLMCYCGIASDGKAFKANRWIVQTLIAAADSAKSRQFFDIMPIFIEEASLYFSNKMRHLKAGDRRITMMFTGYLKPYDDIFEYLISNFQDFDTQVDYIDAWPGFRHKIQGPRTDHSLIQAIGQFSSLTEKHENDLRLMVTQKKPYHAIRSKVADVICDIARSQKSNNTVGEQITVATLSVEQPLAPIIWFGSNEVESHIPLIDTVDLRAPGAPWATDIKLESSGSPTIYPKVHRNAPCPCRSGKKYKYCHRQPLRPTNLPPSFT